MKFIDQIQPEYLDSFKIISQYGINEVSNYKRSILEIIQMTSPLKLIYIKNDINGKIVKIED